MGGQCGSRGDSGRGGRGGETEGSSQPLPSIDVTAIADTRTRSVIVRAKGTDMEIIEGLINKLDLVATVVSEVRVFPLKNTDAQEVSNNLKELLAMASSSRGGRNGNGNDAQVVGVEERRRRNTSGYDVADQCDGQHKNEQRGDCSTG